MSLRREFVGLADAKAVPFAELCRRYGISRKTGYKWLARSREQGPEGLEERSRRPRGSPKRTPEAIEAEVVALRREHPAWGGRKLAWVLQQRGVGPVPAPSTITHILRRHGLLEGEQAAATAQRWQRFEHPAPNDLWQMDFKGHFPVGDQHCFALTVLDDHSRYNLVLAALDGTNTPVVQNTLIKAFRRYGLPRRINADNGQPWGAPRASHGLSQLTVWLIRLEVQMSFSRPAHPQTNGKDERFHRTLQAEVLRGPPRTSLTQVQAAFDRWRPVYNEQRPHEALGMAVPASRYRPSARAYPESLPPIEYGPDDEVVIVDWHGLVRFRGRELKVSNALHRHPVAFRPDPKSDGCYQIFFCHQLIDQIDLRTEPS